MEGEGLAYVLVIGDEGPDRQAIEEILMADGFAVSAVALHEVLALSDLVPPKLVVMHDPAELPAVVDSVQRLRSFPPVIGVPLLVVGREQGVEVCSALVAAGAAACLVAPLSSDVFLGAAKSLAQWQGRGDSTEKRRRVRRPLYMGVDVEIRARGLRVAAQMLDASGGGCRLELPEGVAKGEALKIAIGLQEMGAVGLAAEVRWARTLPNGRFEAGVRFTGTSALLAGKVLGLVPVTGTT